MLPRLEPMDVEIEYLDDVLVRGTTLVRLYNPTGNAARQRQMAVSLVMTVKSAERKAIERNFHRLMSTFVPLLQTQRVDSIAGRDDLAALSEWLIARLRNRGMGPARLERVELTDDSGPSFSMSPATKRVSRDETGDFVSLLESCELVGHFTPEERFNTRSDREAIRQILETAGDEPVQLACFLCPPYVGEVEDSGATRYVSVHDTFDDDPASYNFDYHYRLYIDCLSGVARLAAARGIAVAPIIVFSDWALIGIDQIRATLGSDSEIVSRMARFREGMMRFASERLPAVAVTTFQEIGVPAHLPLGLAASGAARETWLRNFASMSADGFSTAPLNELLDHSAHPNKLLDLLDWRAFTTIPPSPHRSTVIDCLKVYHNICRLRFAALSGKEQHRLHDIGSDAAGELRYESYIDAILRLVQYQLYSALFVERFGQGICCYQDPGFTACGNLFRRPMFPVLFLDPELVLATK